MKKMYHLNGKVLCGILCLLLNHFVMFAQLNGNYTINPTIAASNTNYLNWASAVGDLLSGSRTDGGTPQGAGVNGPVVFTVYDTFYNTQVTISAITGASYYNTITFKSAGGDSTKCVLRYASATTSTNDYVLMLNGADYITFKQIGFERTGSDAYYTVIQITGDADRNSFIRCWMKTRKVPGNVSTGWQTGVGSHFFFAGNGDSTLIQQNRIIYGYNGSYGTTACTGNIFDKNVFDTTGCISIYMLSQTGFKVNQNIFNLGDFGSGQGHYVSYAIRIESSPSISITKNKMYMTATNCQVVRAMVFVSLSGSAASPNIINNNWVLNYGGTSSCSGISLYGVNYLDLYYNNFLLTSSLAAGAVIHHNSTYTNTYIQVKNNNLINKGGGMIYDFPSTNGGLDTVLNNNVFVSGTVLGKMNNISYNTLSAWIAATGKDANSMNVDPGYVSNTDLHVSNIAINAKAVPYFRVNDDIDGDTRHATTPDIGADEFFPIANDAGISSLDSPLVFCAGVKNVKIKFQNFGSDTLKNLQILWRINGVSQGTYNWSGAVPPGSSSSSIYLGNYNFAPNTAYLFQIWTNNPNGVSDGNKLNDTLTTTRYAGMGGTYTIGAVSGTDFQSFNNAITAMTSRGICAPITFNVYDGIYNEQITLAQLPGMGATRPVIFQSISGDSSMVIVRLPSSNATGNNNAACQLAGADYVTFKGMTFQRTGTNTISQVIHILNGSHNNAFINCQMINIVVTTTNANGINVWSDQGEDNNNSFINNYIKFGTNCMLYLGTATSHEKGTLIQGNVFDSAYSSLVQIGYNDGLTMKGNIFRNSISRTTGNYDLQLLDCDSAILINGNYFYNANSDYSIYLSACNTYSGIGIIANNFIAKSTATGIYIDASDNLNVVFNSIYMNGSSTTNAGIATSSGSSYSILMKNNNIVLNGGIVFNIYSGTHISSSNRNNLKTSGSPFAYWGSNYSNLSALSSATGKDLNSLSVDPLFTSSTDLHVKNPALKRAGEAISGVTKDIDGDNRHATTPDIGADEFLLSANDAAMVAITQPPAVVCEGVFPVAAVIKNYGNDTLKSATINWSVNSVAQSPYSWAGNLPTFATDTFTVGYYSFSGNTTPVIKFTSLYPNGQTDAISFNDTISISRLIKSKPAANAGTDKNLCIGDSVLIGTSPVTGYTYKWFTLTNIQVATSAQIYVKTNVDTTFVLEVTDVVAGCSNTDTVNIFVRPQPSSSFTVNNAAQCLGGNNFIFTNTSTGAATYLWKFGDNTTSTAISPSKTFTKDNNYKVELIAISTYGCKDTSDLTVNVWPQPVAAFTINNNSQCLNGNSFLFTNTSSGQSSDFWDFGDTTFSSLATPTAKTYLYSGTKTVKLVVVNTNGCSDSTTKNADVRPHPTTDFNINNNSQCLKGNNFNFTNSSSGAASYKWDFGDGSTATSIHVLHIYNMEGTFPVKLVSTSVYNCKDSLTKNVFVRPMPKAGFTVNDTAQCLSPNQFYFTDTSKIGSGSIINSWVWLYGDGKSANTQNPLYAYPSDGFYTVKLVVASDFNCKDSTTVKVSVYPDPDAAFDVDDSSQCLDGNHFVFTNNSTIKKGTLTYLWNMDDGNVSSSKDYAHSYAAAGSYLVKLNALSSAGCTDSIMHSVIVHPMPVVFLGDDDTLYNAESKVLDAGAGFDSYLWSGSETSRSITVDSSKYGLGVKTFWVKVTKNGCDGYDTIVITIMKSGSVFEPPVPVLKVYPNPTSGLLSIETLPLTTDVTLFLTNAFGKTVKTMTIKRMEQGSLHQMDISDLAQGIYYLNAGNKLVKIVKY